MPRPRKATAQKKAEGTYRPDRANPSEPEFEAYAPEPPAWLCDAALEEWCRVVPILTAYGVLAPTDMAVMASYCELFAEVVSLTARIGKGELFLVEEGGRQKYPLTGERRDCILRLQSLAGELGLSPASRAKVNAVPKMPKESAPQRLRREAKERRRAGADRQPEESRVH